MILSHMKEKVKSYYETILKVRKRFRAFKMDDASQALSQLHEDYYIFFSTRAMTSVTSRGSKPGFAKFSLQSS